MPWSPAPPVSTPCAMSGDWRLIVEMTRAGVRVEALQRVVVPDLANRLAHHGLEINISLGRNLTRDHHQAGAGQRLARHAAGRVLRQAGIQDRVRDLVGNLVRVPFGY